MIAAIAEKKKFSDRSDHSNHKKTTFQRSQRQRSLRYKKFYVSDRCMSQRSVESGFHMIAMMVAIDELFFFSVITAIVAIIWKAGFK